MEASRDLEQLMKNLTLIDKGAQDPYIPRLRQWDKNSLDKVKNSNIMYLIDTRNIRPEKDWLIWDNLLRGLIKKGRENKDKLEGPPGKPPQTTINLRAPIPRR